MQGTYASPCIALRLFVPLRADLAGTLGGFEHFVHFAAFERLVTFASGA